MKKKITNVPSLRKSNINTLLNIIWKKKVTTRKELSKITSITLPTISNIVDLLKEKSLIKIKGKGDSTGGRHPDLLEFNPSSFYVIGVSLKVYEVKGFITDLYGKKIKEFTIDADYLGKGVSILSQLEAIIDNLLKDFKSKGKILGVGVSFLGTKLRTWHPSKDTDIVFTEFGLNACVYGAATLVIKKFLDSELDYLIFNKTL